MGHTRVHVSATEARTLCGLRADLPVNRHLPWNLWMDGYRRDPATHCTQCRRIALRSADRTKAIREADRDTIRTSGADQILPNE